MTLAYIVLATLAGGLASVLIAAALTVHVLGRVVKSLVSLSAGLLLGTALLLVLPEAFESEAGPQALFITLLLGLMFFFLLEKAELYRHGHHHEGDDPHHHHHDGFDAEQAGRGGWSVLVGDSIHNFCDGVIIAAAFLADTRLGVVTAMAVIAHEIPQEVGDFMVLLAAGYSRRRALLLNALSGSMAVVGGLLGYIVLQGVQWAIPYLLALAAASFIYIAVADLMPPLQKHRKPLDFAVQFALLGAGVGVVALRLRYA